jgi:uncharacterized coiled-coil protein SlyX
MQDDATPPPTIECARPAGSGYQMVDRPLVDDMQALRLAGKAPTWARAAWMVVRRAHGTGGECAKVRRLVKLAKTIYGEVSPKSPINSIIRPRPEVADSGSMASMDTHATPTGPQPDLGALLARLAALETREAEREATVAQLRTAVAESDNMMATVITRQVDIEERLEAAGEALTRQAEAAERIAMTGELRLDALHAPTNVSARRN